MQIESHKDQQEHLRHLGRIPDPRSRFEVERFIAEEDPQHDRQQGIADDCPISDMPPLLEEGQRQKIRRQQRQRPKPVQDDRVQPAEVGVTHNVKGRGGKAANNDPIMPVIKFHDEAPCIVFM